MAISLQTTGEWAPRRVFTLRPPTAAAARQLPIEELDLIYAYVYAQVRNRMDAEDLTQQVALKAMPRLKVGAGPAAVRSYLFAIARSALAAFWATRLRVRHEELRDDLWLNVGERTPARKAVAVDRVRSILAALPSHYARLLELRFLRGYSVKEVAAELRTTVGAAKAMQVRALRAAAKVGANV